MEIEKLILADTIMFDDPTQLVHIAVGQPISIIQLNFWLKLREQYFKAPVSDEMWMNEYHEKTFYELFRLKKETFKKLVNLLVSKDEHGLVRKKYRGGNYPVQPEKSVLIFLWYMATQDALIYISDRFAVAPSTVMQIVNALLFIVISIKTKCIFWPSGEDEFAYIRRGFRNYPGAIGAVDGTHVNIKIAPKEQQDSYIDRFMQHSINIMAICTAEKIFSYIFVGFPGSAHDSRVFANSGFVSNIERYGPRIYFPNEEYHILGDSAFPIRSWLMTPFPRTQNFNRIQRIHNNHLSAARVAIENIFGILKGRWRRLQYINTYSISKAVEIATAACVLHNYCYLNQDLWAGEIFIENERIVDFVMNDNREETRLGKAKREHIAQNLLNAY